MNSQYAIRGVVRYYGFLPATLSRKGAGFFGTLDRSRNIDVSRWTVPPHVRLANLPTHDAEGPNMEASNDLEIDPASVEAFLKRYGPLYREDIDEADVKIKKSDEFENGFKRIKVIEKKAGNQFKEGIAAFAGAQYLLRRAWTGDAETIAEDFDDGTLSELFRVASFEIQQNYAARRPAEVLLETEDLWEYMRFLFLTDYAERRIGVCDRKDCPTPYFIQQRKGQRYCSHDCAVLENVRRFRDKEKQR